MEDAVCVQALRPLGPLVAARPLDAASPAQLGVRESAVVARASAGDLLEGVEALLRRSPLEERCAILVPDPEALRVVEEDLHVRPRLTRRVDRLLRDVNRAVVVRE